MSEETSHGAPLRERPLAEQVAVNRHDIAGLTNKVDLMATMITRQTTRIEGVEQRMSATEGQLALAPLTIQAFRKIVRDELTAVKDEEAKRIEALEEKRWKQVQRYIAVVGAIALLGPYIKQILERAL